MQDVPVSEEVRDIQRECDRVIDELNALNEKYKQICESVNELFDLACDSVDRMSKDEKASMAALQKAMEATEFQNRCWNRIDELEKEKDSIFFKSAALDEELEALKQKRALLLIAEERRKKESYNSGGFSIAGIYP